MRPFHFRWAGWVFHMPRKAQPAIERFRERYEVDPETGCWNWTHTLHYKGYSKFWTPEGDEGHTFSYRYFVGPIPDGKEIHHKCRNRKCVNPNHLEVKTHA